MTWHNEPQPPQPPARERPPPAAPTGRPGRARERVVIPAATLLFLTGVGIGAAGGGDGGSDDTASGEPAPTATVFEDIIANGNVKGPTTVTISAGDGAFQSMGCGEWTKTG
ncbi:hypothetical protein GCM10027168_26760 [Streptomyces capparidis]